MKRGDTVLVKLVVVDVPTEPDPLYLYTRSRVLLSDGYNDFRVPKDAIFNVIPSSSSEVTVGSYVRTVDIFDSSKKRTGTVTHIHNNVAWIAVGDGYSNHPGAFFSERVSDLMVIEA